MTDFHPTKADRDLAARFVKEGDDVRVKFGRTNGHIVFHVYQPGGLSRTIRTASDWEEHPANVSIKRNREFAASQPTEALMAHNGE